MVAPRHMHMTITSTIALALASSAFATSCEGDPFVVQAGDSCSAYKNVCAGWTSVQCKGVGTTCTNGNDQLWAGDTCTFSYIGAASARGLSSSSPDPSHSGAAARLLGEESGFPDMGCSLGNPNWSTSPEFRCYGPGPHEGEVIGCCCGDYCTNEPGATMDICKAKQEQGVVSPTCQATAARRLSEQQQQPVYGADKCTWGPSFWCASFENMAGCGAGAVEFCFRQVLSHLAKPIGGDPATWTPTTTTTEQPPLDGADRCTWGPSYWCQSHATMHECGLSSSDCDKYTSNN